MFHRLTEGQIQWIVLIILGSVFATLIYMVFTGMLAERNLQKEIETSADNNYLLTPTNSRIYKFYDDVGVLCFVAESPRQDISIFCIPGQ